MNNFERERKTEKQKKNPKEHHGLQVNLSNLIGLIFFIRSPYEKLIQGLTVSNTVEMYFSFNKVDLYNRVVAASLQHDLEQSVLFVVTQQQSLKIWVYSYFVKCFDAPAVFDMSR